MYILCMAAHIFHRIAAVAGARSCTLDGSSQLGLAQIKDATHGPPGIFHRNGEFSIGKARGK